MAHYTTSTQMIKGTVHCNQYTVNQLKNMDMDLRWKFDNRVLMPGKGYVNYGFNQYFVQNGGAINQTDDKVITIRKDNAETDTRYFKYNGNWFVS